MSSIFKLISSNHWEEAKINGLVSKSIKDAKEGYFHLYQFDDLATVCQLDFSEKDYPIALELEPSSLISSLTWQQPTKERPWKEGHIKSDQIFADLVMNIYSFEWIKQNGETWCKIIGE